MSVIYAVFGWDGLSDSSRVVLKKDVNLALINTGYGTQDRITNSIDHEIPQEELDWMRSTLPSLDRKTLAFHHVSLSAGAKYVAYDEVANDADASRILRDTHTFMAGFF